MNGTIKDVLPVLQSLGVNPDKLGPERLEKLIQLCKTIKDPSQLSQETTKQIIDTLGIVTNKKTESKKSVKIGRNEPCICESGLKYKKCCGK